MTTRELLVGMSALLALAAGCTSDDAPPEAAGLARSEELGRAAVGFAQCMRDNGYQVPDPTYDDDGLPRFGEGLGAVAKDERFDQVRETCGEPLMAALAAAGVPNKKDVDPEDFLAFTRCMREQGIEMPDPTAEDPLAIPKNVFHSPAFGPAKDACKPLLPEAWRTALDNAPNAKPGGGR
jgi:hypothetical protein